jgi:hypothetical protein
VTRVTGGTLCRGANVQQALQQLKVQTFSQCHVVSLPVGDHPV